MSEPIRKEKTYCPHCDSSREPYFSRSEPMGFYCYDCGRDVDDKTLLEERDQWRIKELEAERDTALFDLEFRRDLYKVQEQQLNDVRRERDEYKDLLIRVYDDLFVRRNMGEAVRDLKILMGAVQLTDALAAVKGGSNE